MHRNAVLVNILGPERCSCNQRGTLLRIEASKAPRGWGAAFRQIFAPRPNFACSESKLCDAICIPHIYYTHKFTKLAMFVMQHFTLSVNYFVNFNFSTLLAA